MECLLLGIVQIYFLESFSMNIEALKSNPLFTQSFARQVEIQKAADTSAQEVAKATQFPSKPANGSDFVQKIKGTNEAAGFISTASKGIEALKLAVQTGDSTSILDTAQKISFGGKSILEPQAFDTTAGIITIDLGLNIQNTDLHSADAKDALMQRLNDAVDTLAGAKKSISAPINRAEKEQSVKLQNMNTSGSEFLTRLNNAIEKQNAPHSQPKGLDALEATLNEIGNSIL